MSQSNLHPTIATLLASVRQRIRAYIWLEGLATLVAVAGLAFWISLAIDYLQEPPPAARIAILAVAGIALLVVLYRLIVRRAFVRLSDRSMAILLERRYGQFQDSLLTSVELGTQDGDELEQQMLASARSEALERSGQIEVKKVFNPQPLTRALLAGSLLAVSVLGFVLGAPEALGIWARRTFQLSSELWPRRTHLAIDGFADGKVKVARGSDLELIVKADTAKVVPDVVEVRFRTDEGARSRENMVREGVADPARDPHQVFSHKFQGLLTPLDFDVLGGDDRLRDLRIEVVDSPTITGMTLGCEFPAYMVREELGLYTPRELPVSEFVQLPLGTQVTLRARTNKELVQVKIDRPQESGEVKSQTLDLAGKPGRGFEHVSKLDEDATLLFTLLDTDGIRNREPIRLTLSARPDEPPQVAVRLRGIGTAITPAARLPIVGDITDDYGLSSLWFEYAVDDGEEARRPLSKLPRGAAEAKFAAADEEAFDARDELELKPKQKLLISIKASDTYALEDEPHIGSSQRFVLDVVTPEQLRLLMEGRELNLRRRFEQIIQELTESRESLAMVAIEPPAKPADAPASEASTDEPVASLASLYVQRALQNGRKNSQETQGVAEGFDDIREELVNNRLDTTELRTRLKDRIADPLKQIVQLRFPELELRLETLLTRLADQEKGPSALAAAAEQMDLVLVEMNQVLSQMLELETFNEAIAMLRGIMESQEKIHEKTKKERSSLLKDLLDERRHAGETNMTHTRRCGILGGVLVMFFGSLLASAQESEPAKPASASPAAASQTKLSDEQSTIAEQYRRFEAVLLRMAELTAASDPRRAALLRQAAEQSKNRAINDRFDSIVKLLQNKLPAATAITNQEDLQKELASLMELLLSENRQERLASEQARIKEYLKRVNKLIKDQKVVQGQSAGNADPKQLVPKQGQLADDTNKLAKDIQTNEEGQPKAGENKDGQPQEGENKGQGGEPKPGESGQKPKDGEKPSELKPGEQKPGEPKPGEQKPGEQSPGESKPGEQGENKDQKGKPAKPQKGQPGQPGEQGEPSESQPQQQQDQQADEQNPARKRIEAAEEKMRKAQEKLEQAKRKDAVEEQEQAIRELEQAKAELERILRQLREEEIERMLAQLEARFRKMLAMQIEVYEGTLRLDKVPAARRETNEKVEAGRLSRREAEISLEADKALALLREEGSAVAMPEAVSQMQEDIQDVVVRLAQVKVDARTQGLEEDIIAALEEMIEALQKAQKEMEDQKQQQQQQQQQGKQDKPLIDQIAELKMIRSLQLRVNRRTQRYADLIEGQEQAVEPDLIEAVRELADRERSIHKATRDIVVGRNK